ncbi:hypothetical protein [Sporisorium scitamineum]|uniref:Uncharacterized protein n=1 Tax=Sporisorium scitamineum TaxID=49012 RepID=A0A0F7S4T0_9BASI|nr:hypothetical protein [Sporisorium scitamineum]
MPTTPGAISISLQVSNISSPNDDNQATLSERAIVAVAQFMDLLQRLNNASDNAVVYFHLLNMASPATPIADASASIVSSSSIRGMRFNILSALPRLYLSSGVTASSTHHSNPASASYGISVWSRRRLNARSSAIAAESCCLDQLERHATTQQ